MIAVIADDLSGAAELAGAALRFGLTAEIHRSLTIRPDAETLCWDTDSRCLDPIAASQCLRAVGTSVRNAEPWLVYKKTDSVLRGPVRAELTSLAQTFGKPRVLLVPANPSKHRVIIQGKYYINGKPLHRTVFAHDPEYPRLTSSVRELLDGPDPSMASHLDIEIPDVDSRETLDRLAASVDDHTLAAGGVDFFEAILEHHGYKPRERQERPSFKPGRDKRLFVCGSAAAWIQGRREECERRQIPIEEMPKEIFTAPTVSENDLQRWAERIWHRLQANPATMAAIGAQRSELPFAPQELAVRLARMLEKLLSHGFAGNLFLEGGATAAAFLDRLDWRILSAVSRIDGHLAGFQSPLRPEITLFIKPGSYDWPTSVWP